MRTATLHLTQGNHAGLWVRLGILAIFLLLLLAIVFQMHPSRQASYLPYDAQESEAK